jgi:hypothetical protein
VTWLRTDPLLGRLGFVSLIVDARKPRIDLAARTQRPNETA